LVKGGFAGMDEFDECEQESFDGNFPSLVNNEASGDWLRHIKKPEAPSRFRLKNWGVNL
jgi:hypothetical protein